MWRDRFAPSPTGRLHLGHAFSALTIWDNSRQVNGQFLLRIEDIDTTRVQESFVDDVYNDLAWLGLSWPRPVMRQSSRGSSYASALNTLIELDICYPCRCTRRDIQNALSAPQESSKKPFKQRQHHASAVYHGTCRSRPIRDAGPNDAIRLDMTKAIELLGGEMAIKKIRFMDIGTRYKGEHFLDVKQLLNNHGDIVLARKDIKTSYHLSVVVDDRDMAITHISRGEDLFGVTQVHRLLQALLDITPPIWNHHRLVRDKFGNRLAKRDDARSINELRKSGHSPDDIRQMVGLA